MDHALIRDCLTQSMFPSLFVESTALPSCFSMSIMSCCGEDGDLRSNWGQRVTQSGIPVGGPHCGTLRANVSVSILVGGM